jgi:hypothetical protein
MNELRKADFGTTLEQAAISILEARLAEAKARLADIAMGADMMLQPVMGKLPKWMSEYIAEVKRVSSAPL